MAAPPPSVAILNFEAQYGVDPRLASLLNDRLVESARRSAAFSRVASQKDIETFLGVERTRQMASCDSQSCLAELAGALGTDFIMVGALGKVGASFLLTLRLLDARKSEVAASVQQRSAGEQEDALLDIIPRSLLHVLEDAHLQIDKAWADSAMHQTSPQGASAALAAGSEGGATGFSMSWLALGIGATVATLGLLPMAAMAGVTGFLGGGVALALAGQNNVVNNLGGLTLGAALVMPGLLLAGAGMSVAVVGYLKAFL